MRRAQGSCVVSGPVFYCWPAVGSSTIWNAPHSSGLIILRRGRGRFDGGRAPVSDGGHPPFVIKHSGPAPLQLLFTLMKH